MRGWKLTLATAVAFSALFGVAPALAQADPTNTAVPEITGTLAAGQTLSASTGSWSDSSSTITSYTYQWLLCNVSVCTDIDYATSSTYTLSNSDNGEQLEVTVTAYDSAGNFSFATSDTTDVVGLGSTFVSLSEAVVGSGSVTGYVNLAQDNALNCPGSCGDSYSSGSGIELVAQPSPGRSFVGWSGACAGTNPVCSFTLSSNESVTATFTTPPPPSTKPGPAPTNPSPGTNPPPTKQCYVTTHKKRGHLGRAKFALIGAPARGGAVFRIALASASRSLHVTYALRGHKLSTRRKVSLGVAHGGGLFVIRLRNGHSKKTLHFVLRHHSC